MVDFDDICINLLNAVVHNYQRYLDSNKRNYELLTQPVIIQEMWDQTQDQPGYHDKELLIRALRELENLGWIKSGERTQNERLYYPTRRGLAPTGSSSEYYAKKYSAVKPPLFFTVIGGILIAIVGATYGGFSGLINGFIMGNFMGFFLWFVLWLIYKIMKYELFHYSP